MKKFFQAAAAIKECASLCYTGAMCFYMIFLWVFRQEAAPLPELFSLLLVCVAAPTFNYQMRYIMPVMFCTPYYIPMLLHSLRKPDNI